MIYNEVFDDLEELLAYDEELAKELMSEVGGGDWVNHTIYLHDSTEDFAVYEVEDGWYSTADLDRDWNGAPNLFDYIDYGSLGEALVSSWDESMNFISKDGRVLGTNYGW